MKYRDLNIFFKKNIDNNDITLMSNNSAVIQSIKNIVLTRLGERPFSNQFGTAVLDLMFAVPTVADLMFLQEDIKENLDLLEKRIIVETVTIEYPVLDGSADAKINIEYRPNNTELTYPTQILILTVGN